MRSVVGLGEVSAAGLPGEVGVVVLSVAPQSEAATLGLRQGDVILKLAGTDTLALGDLLRISGGNRVTVFRNQHEIILGTP